MRPLPPIRCRACGDFRPFDAIQVKKVDVPLEGCPPGTMVHNYQYCGDRPDCVAAAEAFDGYLKKDKDASGS